MLTPIDIQKQDFDVSFRGYNADEVDDFLDMVGKDYEKLYKENIEFKDKIAALQASVEQYKGMESSLKDAILLAQKSAEDIKKNASEKADNMVTDAQNRASDMIRQTNDDILARKKELADLQMEIETYKSQMKSLCVRVVELLDKTN